MATKSTRNRDTNEKYNNQMSRSGLISAVLKNSPEHAALYEDVQASEREVRQAHELAVEAAQAVAALKATRDEQRKRLWALCQLAVGFAEWHGRTGPRTLFKSDANDEEAMSAHLIPLIQGLPRYGPPLAEGINEQRLKLLASAEALTAQLSLEQSTDHAFKMALLKSISVVSLAKQVLAAAGIRTLVPTRKKKQALAVVPAGPREIPAVTPVVAQPEDAPVPARPAALNTTSEVPASQLNVA